MRYLALAALGLLCACTVAPPPVTPTAVLVTATIETVTPLPTITLSVSPAPIVTVQPTPDVPRQQFHPMPKALGEINVLDSVCESRATVWLVYDYGMTKVYDSDADARCRAGGTL